MIMKKQFLNKLLAISITTVSLLVLFIPYSLVYYADNKVEGWRSAYIFEDLILTLVYTPFFACWFAYMSFKNKLLKTISLVILVAISTLYFVISFLSLLMTVQDFLPYFGIYLSFLLLPLLLIYLINERSLQRSK